MNKWNELETIYVEADDDYFYYDVELDSFSYFAIGEKAEEDGIIPGDGEEAKKLTWLWILIGIAVLVILYFRFGKKKN